MRTAQELPRVRSDDFPFLGTEVLLARYYDPQTGQFFNVDPKVGETEEPYTYGSDDPVSIVDPSGLFAANYCEAPGQAEKGSCAVQRFGLFDFIVGGAVVAVLFVAVSVTTAGVADAVVADAAVDGAEVSDDLAVDDTAADLTKPGKFAKESISARGPERDFTPEEREAINDIGKESGCHSCGVDSPGTKGGNWVPDHQPPTALNGDNVPQRLYPQCLQCSRMQGLQVARLAQAAAKVLAG